MHIVKADVLGMCFGVRDALKLLDSIVEPAQVTVHGELVHNEKVLRKLERRGFQQVDEARRVALPVTEKVLITAHGVSMKERDRLTQAGKQLLDSTCPLVVRAHDAALRLQQQGYHVLLLGKRGHVEVQGIVEDLHSFHVLETPSEVQTYPFAKLGIMCQTTTTVAHATQMRSVIAQQNAHAEIRFVDTICQPTKDHQASLDRLLEQVQAVVVVGGRNSNNTKQLVARCLAKGVPAYHVHEAGDLRQEWFAGLQRVGLTAGTSTLDETIREVHETLQSYTPQAVLA